MAEKIICPNCEKEVEIPEENLKQFPCPECFQAVMPPPKPLTKQWIIVAAIAGVLLLIAAAMPVVINMIQASVDKECQKIENDFNAKKNAINQDINKYNQDVQKLEAEEAERQKQKAERDAQWEKDKAAPAPQ